MIDLAFWRRVVEENPGEAEEWDVEALRYDAEAARSRPALAAAWRDQAAVCRRIAGLLRDAAKPYH